ncbi:MAG: hypothetical protein H6871_07610 [Methylobacteriaceae bacterium]|nr:hypothetical protein [Methylobacteriaceae bacterium]
MRGRDLRSGRRIRGRNRPLAALLFLELADLELQLFDLAGQLAIEPLQPVDAHDQLGIARPTATGGRLVDIGRRRRRPVEELGQTEIWRQSIAGGRRRDGREKKSCESSADRNIGQTHVRENPAGFAASHITLRLPLKSVRSVAGPRPATHFASDGQRQGAAEPETGEDESGHAELPARRMAQFSAVEAVGRPVRSGCDEMRAHGPLSTNCPWIEHARGARARSESKVTRRA